MTWFDPDAYVIDALCTTCCSRDMFMNTKLGRARLWNWRKEHSEQGHETKEDWC